MGRILVLAGALALIAAGCASDSGSEEDFQDDLAQICEDADERGDELNEDFDAAIEDDDVDEMNEIAEDALEAFEETENELDELNPPEDDEDAFEDLRESLDDTIAYTEDLAELDDIDDLSDFEDEVEDADELQTEAAEELDVEECAPGGGGDDDDSSDDQTDSTDDQSDSTDSTDDGGDIAVGDPVPPEDFIIDFGADAEFDALAEDCFDGAFGACDDLYAVTPVGTDYESYAQTCGGRTFEGDVPSGECENVLG